MLLAVATFPFPAIVCASSIHTACLSSSSTSKCNVALTIA